MLPFLMVLVFRQQKKDAKLRPLHVIFWRYYSTVTDFAKFLGWSTLQPLITAI